MEELKFEKLSDVTKVGNTISEWELEPKIAWLYAHRLPWMLLLTEMLKVLKSQL